MELQSFQYQTGRGWSIKNFPALDSENTLVLVFAAPEFKDNPKPIQELTEYYPKSKIIGCSSAGEILQASMFDHSISVAVIKFSKTTLQLTEVNVNSISESYHAGFTIANQLNQKDLRAIFVLSDGLQINGSELVRGLNSLSNKEVIITGGLAGDSHHFKKTWILGQSNLSSGKVIAVGFYGNHIQIGHGSRGGWDIFGIERRITRSNNNILYELDGKPALALYKEYLGEKSAELPASGLLFPLAVRKDTHDKNKLVRTILAVDEKEQSLTFAGDIPTGYLAQMMRANFDRLISGAHEAGKAVLENMQLQQNTQTLLIAISCVGRRLLLGERTEEELESVLELFSTTTQQIGFYSYGELSPYATGNCDLHNQTMTLTAITET